jgi:hypothetical protein
MSIDGCGTTTPHTPHTVDRGPWGRGWCAGNQPAPGSPEPSTVLGYEGEHPAIVKLAHDEVDRSRRREWAAALRYGAAEIRKWVGTVANPETLAAMADEAADQIEAGDRSPWADAPEPATPPAPQPATAPVGPDAATDPSGGAQPVPGVLGWAWLDPSGDLWRWLTREEAEQHTGPVREVLLVDPAVGDVLAAVQRWFASISMTETAEEADIALALNALGDHPADFYEEDEPVGPIAKAFAAGPHGRTGRPGVHVEASGVTLEPERTATTGGPDHDGLTGQPHEPAPCPNCNGTGRADHPLVPVAICEDCKGTGGAEPAPEPDSGTGPGGVL